ncbi:hypothetical protein [Nocardiopsis coralliicola]
MLTECNRIDVDDVLHLRAAAFGAAGGGPDLVMVPSGGGDPVECAVEWDGADGTAKLPADRITAGSWEVGWTRGGRSGPVTTTDPGLNLGDRAAALEQPRSIRLTPGRAADGRMLVHAEPVAPYAEVQWIDTAAAAEGVTVSGVLAYAADPTAAEGGEPVVVVRQRELDGLLVLPARLHRRAFSCTIPLAPIAERYRPERPHNEWDLWLAPSGLAGPAGPAPDPAAELRIAAHFDDVAGKKRKAVYPETAFPAGESGLDGSVRVGPYFTVADELSLLAAAEPPAAAEADPPWQDTGAGVAQPLAAGEGAEPAVPGGAGAPADSAAPPNGAAPRARAAFRAARGRARGGAGDGRGAAWEHAT